MQILLWIIILLLCAISGILSYSLWVCIKSMIILVADNKKQKEFNEGVVKTNDLLHKGIKKLSNKRTVIIENGYEAYIQNIPVPKFTNMSLEHGVCDQDQLYLLGIRKLKEKKT